MRRRYVRRKPTKEQSRQAAAVSGAVSLTLAVGAGLVTFYLARMFLAREELSRPEDRKLLDAPSD